MAGKPLSLVNPVRVIWRPFLPGDSPPSPERTAAVAAAIAEASPLMVELWLPARWPQLPPLPCAQVAVFAPPGVLGTIPPGVVRVADWTPYDGTVPPAAPAADAKAGAFLLSVETAPLFPAAVAAAAEAGVGTITLPPLPFPLFDRIGGPLASPSALDAVWRMAIAPSLELLRGFHLEVHDRFLLERLRGAGLAVGAPPSDAGCQAGTALAFIGPDGIVYPCPIWPVPLGSLPAPWEALWQGEPRRRFLADFPRHPSCGRCPRWPSCLGGCPGASAALHAPGLPDPLCPELPRD